MSIITLYRKDFEDISFKERMRYEQILDRLMTGEKTADEVATELFNLKLMPSKKRNYIEHKLIELKNMGLVKALGKVYEITPIGIEQRYCQYIPRID